jgi:hypothetical protein
MFLTYSALTEFWNGSSWTELNDLSTARVSHGGIGSTSSALAVGRGNNGSYLLQQKNGQHLM